MPKCKRCSASGLALKLDFDGHCQACHDTLTKEKDSLIAELRAFKEEYMQIPNAREEADRILSEAHNKAANIVNDARSGVLADISSAEAALEEKERKASSHLEQLKANASAVKKETEDFLAALLSSAAHDFSNSPKTRIQFSQITRSKPGVLLNDSPTFVYLSPSKFKKIAKNGFIAIDFETTGLHAGPDKIIEIGAVRYDGSMKPCDQFQSFVNPGMHIPASASNINHIYDSMVSDAPDIATVLPDLLNFIEGYPVIAHNADFDISFLKDAVNRCRIRKAQLIEYADTLIWARRNLHLKSNTLGDVAKHLGIPHTAAHRALGDCHPVGEIAIHMINS